MVRKNACHGQPGDGRGVLNGGEALVGRLDHAQCGARVVRHQRRHRDDGVDATAERDEGPSRVGLVAGRRGRVRIRSLHP